VKHFLTALIKSEAFIQFEAVVAVVQQLLCEASPTTDMGTSCPNFKHAFLHH
jgi:hypothetical protein